MERSSPKPVIALVLFVVCIVSCFEDATAQYSGSSNNGAAATGPMAAGGSCSLAVATAVLAVAAGKMPPRKRGINPPGSTAL
uniref:Uncharacterized protein n=1 Tax=Oryza nivara TaxID=4536 RepID=A0A0E0IY24_ORYNI